MQFKKYVFLDKILPVPETIARNCLHYIIYIILPHQTVISVVINDHFRSKDSFDSSVGKEAVREKGDGNEMQDTRRVSQTNMYILYYHHYYYSLQ